MLSGKRITGVRNDKDSMHMHATENLHMTSTPKEELLRFNTTAGNPIKEILLKLNLPDHMLILMDSKHKFSDSSDDEYSSVDGEDLENVDFYTTREEDVIIKNLTTHDDFLNRLCSTGGLFRGGVVKQGSSLPNIPEDDPDDSLPQAEHRKCTGHLYANFKKRFSSFSSKGDVNPICTLGDYSKPSHEGYKNTVELLVGNNNDLRDFAKLVKAISLPQDVPSTSDRRLIPHVRSVMVPKTLSTAWKISNKPLLNMHPRILTKREKLARKNELKVRGTLLMAIPDKHRMKFNSHKDAKSLMEAIEKRFSGNTETKKVQKTLLKQQFENFSGFNSESLDQIHDRLQKLVSQLEIHGVSLSLRRM
nr:ribonuclease H-like domain-containing protein [Tanacetum cinerariifolium]